MSVTAHGDSPSKSSHPANIPLQRTSSRRLDSPKAGPSCSPDRAKERENSLINEIRLAEFQSRPPSRNTILHDNGTEGVVFKGKTLNALKQEFEQKCAVLEKEYPELVPTDTDTGGLKVIHEMLKNRDAQDVKNHYENIDTLLVFAGLYSAILTAFLVEAYKLLRRDPSEVTLQVLVQISQQLGSFAVTSGFVNATYIPPSLPTLLFTPERSAVWLNGLWFVALILSLATASLGMLVKQWLREYLNTSDATPEAQRRVRLFRIRGLRNYKVSEIAAFLPLLLQVSLVLFFAGLVVFTRSVHTAIGWVVTGFVSAWLTFLVVTTSLPWFSSSCPYKTPFLKPITVQFKRCLSYAYKMLEDMIQYIGFSWIYLKLPERLFRDDAETQVSEDASLDVEILVDAYKTSGNINVWEMIMHCVDPQSPSASITLLTSVINKRHSPSETSQALQWDAWFDLSLDERRLFMKSLIICIRRRFIHAFGGRPKDILSDNEVDSLLVLNECSRGLVTWLSDDTDDALREMTSMILREALSVPFAPDPLLKYASGLLEGGPNTLRIWECFNKATMVTFLEASIQVFEQPGLMDEEKVLNHWGGIMFCVGRSTVESWPELRDKLPRLSNHVASKVNSLPDPSDSQTPHTVFRWHRVLDVALKLYERIPGIINTSLFEALHTRSVKAFDLYVEIPEDPLWGYIKGKPRGTSQTLTAPVGSIDWNDILGKHSEVDVRARGYYKEYGDEWDYQRLRVDYKHRMEFMLNYERWWREEFYSEMANYDF